MVLATACHLGRLMSCLPALGLQPNYAMYKGMVTAAAEADCNILLDDTG